MEILLAFIYGAGIGAVAHAVTRGRELRGVALGPLLGAVVGGAVWLALTWAGMVITEPWIWLISLVAVPVVVFPAVLVLTRIRRVRDDRERARLNIG